MSMENLKYIFQKSDIKWREPIWVALSDFYLDTELQEADFKSIATTILESPYSLKEVKQINKHEVFPVLYPNLLSIAGEWAGFDEQWLITEISRTLDNKNKLKQVITNGSYFMLKWMLRDYWEQLETVYTQMKQDTSQR